MVMLGLSSLVALSVLTKTLLPATGTAHGVRIPIKQVEGRKIAVLVGVSSTFTPAADSNRRPFRSLRYAHSDAERLAVRLKELGWETKLLQAVPGATDSGATKAGILSAIGSIATRPEDSFLFYFSGHGIQVEKKAYFVPFDGSFVPKVDEKGAVVLDESKQTQYTQDLQSLLSADELSEAMAAVQARSRIAIFDACQEEPNVSKDGRSPDGGFIGEKLGTVMRRSAAGEPRTAIFLSCNSGQKSYEDERLADGKGAGVFTNAFLKALESPNSIKADGSITPVLVSEELTAAVGDWVKSNPGRVMTPIFKLDGPPEVPLLFGKADAQKIPTKIKIKVDPPDAEVTVNDILTPQRDFEFNTRKTEAIKIKITARAIGYEPYEQIFSYVAGVEANIPINLRKKASGSELSSNSFTLPIGAIKTFDFKPMTEFSLPDRGKDRFEGPILNALFDEGALYVFGKNRSAVVIDPETGAKIPAGISKAQSQSLNEFSRFASLPQIKDLEDLFRDTLVEEKTTRVRGQLNGFFFSIGKREKTFGVPGKGGLEKATLISPTMALGQHVDGQIYLCDFNQGHVKLTDSGASVFIGYQPRYKVAVMYAFNQGKGGDIRFYNTEDGSVIANVLAPLPHPQFKRYLKDGIFLGVDKTGVVLVDLNRRNILPGNIIEVAPDYINSLQSYGMGDGGIGRFARICLIDNFSKYVKAQGSMVGIYDAFSGAQIHSFKVNFDARLAAYDEKTSTLALLGTKNGEKASLVGQVFKINPSP